MMMMFPVVVIIYNQTKVSTCVERGVKRCVDLLASWRSCIVDTTAIKLSS